MIRSQTIISAQGARGQHPLGTPGEGELQKLHGTARCPLAPQPWLSPCLTGATALGGAKAAEAAKATKISAERLEVWFAILKPAEDLDLLPVMGK